MDDYPSIEIIVIALRGFTILSSYDSERGENLWSIEGFPYLA
jgi:hypothetical protein